MEGRSKHWRSGRMKKIKNSSKWIRKAVSDRLQKSMKSFVRERERERKGETERTTYLRDIEKLSNASQTASQ
jgi:hypothetical protein